MFQKSNTTVGIYKQLVTNNLIFGIETASTISEPSTWSPQFAMTTRGYVSRPNLVSWDEKCRLKKQNKSLSILRIVEMYVTYQIDYIYILINIYNMKKTHIYIYIWYEKTHIYTVYIYIYLPGSCDIHPLFFGVVLSLPKRSGTFQTRAIKISKLSRYENQPWTFNSPPRKSTPENVASESSKIAEVETLSPNTLLKFSIPPEKLPFPRGK